MAAQLALEKASETFLIFFLVLKASLWEAILQIVRGMGGCCLTDFIPLFIFVQKNNFDEK